MRHILSVLIALIAAAQVTSADPLLLSRDSRQTEVDAWVSYLMDADGTLSAEDAFERRESFEPLGGQSVQIPRNGVMWVYLEIVNNTDTTEWYLENQLNVEEMALYRPVSGAVGSWVLQQRTGNRVPFTQRLIKTRRPTVELTLPSGETTNVLLRVSDYQSSNVRLRLFTEGRFAEYVQNDTLLLGLAFGCFAALILYNLLVFATARDRLYLVYALYMISFLCNQLAQERLFSHYLQPHQPYGFFWFVLFSAATALFGVEFFRLFMDTPRTTPRFDVAARMVQAAAILIGVSAVFTVGPTSADMINVVALIAMAVILSVLIIRIAAGDRLALICLAGSIAYLLGTTAEILSALIPVPITPFVVHGQLYGALAQVLFLGFALGRRTSEVHERYLAIQADYKEELERSIAERTRDLEAVTEQLHQQAVTDPLTGLHNRAELSLRAPEIDAFLRRSDEGASPYTLTVVYLDLDNFKFVNDSYGHGFGDEVLRNTARILAENTRGYDMVFRLGGDEFAIVMPETEQQQALKIVERIRAAFGTGYGDDAVVSVSAGLASSRDIEFPTLDSLIERADRALLEAKAAGKDRAIPSTQRY